MIPLLCADSLGIQWCWVPIPTLILVEVVVQSGSVMYSAVVMRKASSTVSIEGLDNTTAVTIMMLEWPVLEVRNEYIILLWQYSYLSHVLHNNVVTHCKFLFMCFTLAVYYLLNVEGFFISTILSTPTKSLLD